MSFDQFVLASGEVGGQTTGISFVLCVFLMAHGMDGSEEEQVLGITEWFLFVSKPAIQSAE